MKTYLHVVIKLYLLDSKKVNCFPTANEKDQLFHVLTMKNLRCLEYEMAELNHLKYLFEKENKLAGND